MKFIILHTSDVHGYFTSKSFVEKDAMENHGLSRAKTYIEKTRRENSNVIYIDTGDLIQGSPLSSFYKEENRADGNIEVINLLKPDALVLGNHDFNYGLSYLESAKNSSDAPILCANVENNSDKEIFHAPYKIIEIEDVRIGILGLVTQYIPHWESEENIAGLKFNSALESAKKFLPILRNEENCDIVIVAYHGGFEKDLETGEELEKQTGENEGYALLKSGLDFDVLITGHQHLMTAGVIDEKAYAQPGFAASNISEISFDFEEGKVKNLEAKLVDLKEYYPDEEMEEFLKNDMISVDEMLDKKAGTIEPSARIENIMEVQINGHPFIDLINQIQMEALGVDIAATSIFNENIRGLERNVTMREIMASYPFNNTLMKVEINGKELKEILEYNSLYFVLDGENLIVNPKYKFPKNLIFNYDIYSGISYTYDYKNELGNRLVSLIYKGKEVEDTDILQIALNSYRAGGGGDFPVLDSSQVISETNKEMPEIIFDYIKEKQEVKIKDMPSIKIIGYKDYK